MVIGLIMAGIAALKDYIALHVLTCLIPAFLLAGGMVSFISKEAIIRYLGAGTSKLKSFSLASFASFFIAACSCTVIPVASGIYYQGAGVGAAFIFLWVAPATNILSIIYTGTILGGRMVISRIISALFMAFVVGYIMSYIFQKEETKRIQETTASETKVIAKRDIILLLLILVSLLSPNYLIQKGPYFYKIIVWLITSLLMLVYAFKAKTSEEIRNWLRESWWFVKTIFPLLLAGVFIVGVIGKLLPQDTIQKWLGGSSVLSSFLATVLGQIMYFATMTEAPFVDTLMKLGMGRGPALALLLTGPGMSLPNMLAIGKVFGAKKAAVYIVSIMVMGTFVGWFVGNFVF